MVILRSSFSLSVLFFFKQKTAYEMRISDWSSDVCSSDLSREVVVVNYGGRSADIWWDRNRAALSRIGNLTVLDIGSATVAALGAMANRTMRLQGMVQDGQFELYGEGTSLAIESSVRMAPAGRAH